VPFEFSRLLYRDEISAVCASNIKGLTLGCLGWGSNWGNRKLSHHQCDGADLPALA
jgi:hypothetical protein